jgi:UDP-N-acetylmuramoyl-tripeptide--D-alanyl-D-alanine ligase
MMFRTTFIAITGSAGKTTTAHCVGAILSAHYPTNWTPGGRNARGHLALNVLRTRFHHRFTVIEVGTRAPGALRRAAWMIAPDIAVVLTVLGLHTDAFPTLDEMAAEKEQLLSRLGRRGLAILNADDARVRDMGARRRGQVRTFGCAAHATLRGSEISSVWPRRLSFRADYAGQSCRAESQLVGEHMATPALAALAVAVSCGVPLPQAAAALGSVPPVPGRMQPMMLPNGVTVLRDDFNASFATLEPGLNVMRTAQGSRRIVIVGDVLDSPLTVRPRMRELGRRVAASADVGVFIGTVSKVAAKAATEAGLKQAFACQNLREAVEFLQRELQPGDLVLVQGWTAHHIERVVLAQTGTIACWIERCNKHMLCDQCPELKLVPLRAGPAAPE